MTPKDMTNWYDKVRAEARNRFAEGRWPETAEEEWRRSDVSKLGLDAYIGAARPSSVAFTIELPTEAVAAGARLVPVASSLQVASRAALNRLREEGDRFAAWNLSEGEAWALELPPGLVLTSPISVEGRLSGRAAHPRLVVIAGEGSSADVVYRVVGGEETGLVNAALDLELDEAASLRLFESHASGDEALWFVDTKARVGRDARLLHLVAETAGTFVKSRVDCSLAGIGAEAVLDGVFLAEEGRHIDLRTVQRHLAPRASSRSLYKGVLGRGGRSIVQGLIEVAKDAAGTDAFLANRNILLGGGARADSIPTLRIGNNDVRCSHGSTTGKLSESELFYLESRGFDRASARALLVLGFFNEIFDKSPESFSAPIVERITSRLDADSLARDAAAHAAAA